MEIQSRGNENNQNLLINDRLWTLRGLSFSGMNDKKISWKNMNLKWSVFWNSTILKYIEIWHRNYIQKFCLNLSKSRTRMKWVFHLRFTNYNIFTNFFTEMNLNQLSRSMMMNKMVSMQNFFCIWASYM